MAGIDGGMGGVRIGGANLDRQDGVGDLGGQQVREGGSGIKRAFSNFAHGVKAFFDNIGTKFSNWREARAEQREAAALQRASGRLNNALQGVKADIMSEQITGKTVDRLSAAMKHAVRIDPQNPQQILREHMSRALSDLGTDQLKSFISMDFEGLKVALNTVVDGRTDRAVNLVQGLERGGFGGGGDVDELLRAGDRINQANSTMIDCLRDGVAMQRRERFENAVGGLFTVADDGQINSVHHNLQISIGDGPKSGMTILQESAMGKLESALEKPTMVVDVAVTSEAVADWPRMNINFHRPDGQVVNSNAGGLDREAHAEKIEDCALSLYEITGGDETTTTVVSSMITQHGWRDVVRGFVGTEGQEVPMRLVPGGYDGATVKRSDGDLHVDHPRQIGEAKFDVSRNENGDIEIRVDWLLLANGVGLEMQAMSPNNPEGRPMAGEEGRPINALGVQMNAVVTISASAASEGRLEFTSFEMRHAFSGKFEALN